MTRYEQDKWYIPVLILYLNARIFVDIIRYAARLFNPAYANYVEPVRNVIYVFCVIYIFYLWIRHGIIKVDFFILAIGLSLFLASYVIEPGIRSIALSGGLLLFTRVLPSIFYFEHLTRYDKVLIIQKKLMPVIIIYAGLAFFATQTEDYIALSYNLVPFAVLYIISGLQSKEIFYVAGGGIVLFITLIYGSRGSVLCAALALLAFFVFNVVRGGKHQKKRDVFLLILLIVILVVLFFFGESIAAALFSKYQTSRTLTMLLKGKITADHNRNYMKAAMSEAIWKNPFIPHGLFADRIIISQALDRVLTHLTYPHNYIYEVLYQFGVPIGTALLLYNLFLVIRWIRRMKGMDASFFVFSVSFIIITFCQLMLSNSYLINYAWGIAIGMLINKRAMRSRKGSLIIRDR